MSRVNKKLQLEVLDRYRVHDHSRSALLRIDKRSPSAKQIDDAAEAAEHATLLTRSVEYAHRHHSVRELIEKLTKRLPIDREDLVQDGVITLLELSKTISAPIGSVGFQRALLVAIRRDLLDKRRWINRRKPRKMWEFVQMQDVAPEEGCSSEDPSSDKLGLYYKPISPFRETVLRDAVCRLRRAAAKATWGDQVLQDLLAEADVDFHASVGSAHHYRTAYGQYDRIPMSKVFGFYGVRRRQMDRFKRALEAELPADDRRFMLACADGMILPSNSGGS